MQPPYLSYNFIIILVNHQAICYGLLSHCFILKFPTNPGSYED
jgi:hypothetical protein